MEGLLKNSLVMHFFSFLILLYLILGLHYLLKRFCKSFKRVADLAAKDGSDSEQVEDEVQNMVLGMVLYSLVLMASVFVLWQVKNCIFTSGSGFDQAMKDEHKRIERKLEDIEPETKESIVEARQERKDEESKQEQKERVETMKQDRERSDEFLKSILKSRKGKKGDVE